MKGFYGFDSQFLSMLDSVQQDLDLKITFRKSGSKIADDGKVNIT